MGTAISTWMVSGWASDGSAWKAPVAGSSRLKVVMSVSRISWMFVEARTFPPAIELGATPYLAKAAAGVSEVTGPGRAVAAGAV